MKNIVILSALIVLVSASVAVADLASVNFCVDANLDEVCDQEFTAFVELYGLTDMKLLEIALEEELTVDNWDEYLWAVTLEGYAYDYLPQFDGASQVALEDGDEVQIWFTGWQWYSSDTAPTESTPPDTAPSDGSSGSSSNSGAGASMPGSAPSGSAEVTTVSSWLKGYSVEVDGLQIGTEGTGSDLPDGIYTFYVSGNQQHSIKINHPQFWKSWTDFFMAGGSYTANIDVPGRVVPSG